MRTFRVFVLLVAAVFFPVMALAQTYGSDPQTSTLLTQIATLEQEIQLLTGSPTAASPPASVPANPISASAGSQCPLLNNTLSLGSVGPDVSSLQAFLEAQGLFNASVTGYFGLITQGAVEQWQELNGVVSGGDASSTGFGVVGPRTRAAIAVSCGSGQPATSPQQNACLPTQPPVAQCPAGWQPVAGANGCTSYYQCTTALPRTTTGTASAAATSSSASQSCPVVTKPSCTGSVMPFQTNSNGCVTSYECVI